MDDDSRGRERDHDSAHNSLRLAALRTEHVQPLEARLDEAARLLLQLRGLAAGGNPIPADLDQEIFAWLHVHAEAKKGQQP